MSSTLRSSVLMLLRDASEELGARPGGLKMSEIVCLAFLAQGFGHEGYVKMFVAAFMERLSGELESRG